MTDNLKGVIAAIATAVDEQGEPDCARSTALARYLLADGCDGLNVLGTTGEATSFSLAQRKRVMTAYRDAVNARKPTDFPIPVFRAFDLHEGMDKGSAKLGRVAAGTLARPLGPKIAVVERGDYVVRKLTKRHPRVRVGDHVHTLVNEGEGAFRVLHKDAWVGFSEGQVELRPVRQTVLESWTKVSVGGREGYAPGLPFEGCLE